MNFYPLQTQPAITCSKLTIGTLEQGVKYLRMPAGKLSKKLFRYQRQNLPTISNLLNPLSTSVPFLYPLNTSENLRFSGVFRGFRSGALVENGLRPIFQSYRNHLTKLYMTGTLSFTG